MEKMSKVDNPMHTSISAALLKLKKGSDKKGVNLLDITKKLSSKKFGKK